VYYIDQILDGKFYYWSTGFCQAAPRRNRGLLSKSSKITVTNTYLDKENHCIEKKSLSQKYLHTIQAISTSAGKFSCRFRTSLVKQRNKI